VEPKSDGMEELIDVPRHSEIVSGDTQSVVPTQNITASDEQTLELLQSAASGIPASLLQDAIGAGHKITEVREVCGTSSKDRPKTNSYVIIRRYHPSKERPKSCKILYGI